MKAGLNWLLFAIESGAALVLLWLGVPMYQRLLIIVPHQPAEAHVIVEALIAAMLCQTGFWLRLRLLPALRFRRQVVLGHVIQFLGQLSFVFMGGMFAVVFLVRYREVGFSFWRLAVLMAALFSIFCYALELGRLGRGLCEGRRWSKPRHDLEI